MSYLDMSKPSESCFPHFPYLILYGCDPYFLFDSFIPDPIQSCMATQLPDHPHLNYHQSLDLVLFIHPTLRAHCE